MSDVSRASYGDPGTSPLPTPAALPFLKHTNSTDFLSSEVSGSEPLVKCYTAENKGTSAFQHRPDQFFLLSDCGLLTRRCFLSHKDI